MSTIRALFLRLAGLFHAEKSEREFADEIESHLQMQIEDNVRRGMTLEQARRDALIKSGGLESAKEAYRDRRGLPSLEAIRHDLRYAARMMRKNPGFTAVVTLTLALGIGANTAIFSVVHAALAPMAISDPDRAVMVWTENAKRDWHQFPASVPDYFDWKASGIFASLGAMEEAGFNLRLADRTERVSGLNVTPEVFQALASNPQLGRVFHKEDMQAGHDQVVILCDELWRSRFAADAAIIGKSVILDGAPHTVIGVLPSRFPKFSHEGLYAPLVFSAPRATSRGTRNLAILGRLQPGLSLAAAQKRMADLSLRLSRQYEEDSGNSARLQRVEDAFVEDARTLLGILLGAVGFVLLIACANIANLLLARGTGRSREMAIRTALGAGRWRLSRQLLAENILLALFGGLLAVVPAVWAIHFIASFHLDELPNADLVTLNSSVLIFNFALSLATGILFGLVPAWQAWKGDVNSTLKATGRSQAGGVHQRVGSLFVVSEVALTVVLLVGAGLMLQSFLRLRSADPGYKPQDVLTMGVALSDRQYSTPEKQTAFFEQVVREARALPGVRNVSATQELPNSDNIHGSGLLFPDRPTPRTEDIPVVLHTSVMSDYFRTMQIPLVRGRYFNEWDRRNSRLVALVDEWAAKRYWPNQNPVGKQLKLGGKLPPREIVGVVGNVDQGILLRLLKGRVGQVYVPFAQDPEPAMALVLRTDGDPAQMIPAVRNVVRNVDLDQPVFRVQTMEAALAAGRASQQLATWLLGGFALVALLLAAIGLYGLMAYNVGQRTREFGIRMSLGARQQDVLKLVVRQGFILTSTGMLLGLAGAFALTRLMSSLLYGVRSTDPLTFLAVTGLLAAVALLASYIPARRATKVDPSDRAALRVAEAPQ